MKSLVLLAAVLAVASAAPQFNNYQGQQAYKQSTSSQQYVEQSSPEQKSSLSQYVQAKKPVLPPIAITSFSRDVQPAGDYKYSYGTEHGINIQEDAKIKEIIDEKNEPHHVPAVTGSYSYVGDDGQTYTVNYIADEFGFRASGAHLPNPPAVPADIAKSIKTLPPLPKDEPVQQVQKQPAFQQYQQQQYQQRYQQYKQFN
ncbi:Cuticle Protein CPR RR-1 14 [Frankliniella occidentalis]|uniref:Endocuticle structural glycoprotein SgAbd-2-like n=1 Tax=Frankliniella occidentalis TaxID=133901 RepID=A0A6J1RYS3_FRAOC|nr:endocuticle structural glycoprotein SgAbd-2-like [Frankliniella occidentalis]KAE8739712.1 Cuticle Protein CPR RR-1 14 [Frankliniella occidentalis]